MTRIDTTLGDLISVFYEEFYELYQDEELAALAASTVVNDLLADAMVQSEEQEGEGAAA